MAQQESWRGRKHDNWCSICQIFTSKVFHFLEAAVDHEVAMWQLFSMTSWLWIHPQMRASTYLIWLYIIYLIYDRYQIIYSIQLYLNLHSPLLCHPKKLPSPSSSWYFNGPLNHDYPFWGNLTHIYDSFEGPISLVILKGIGSIQLLPSPLCLARPVTPWENLTKATLAAIYPPGFCLCFH